MDRARWQQIQSVFHEAAGLPQSQQPAFLEMACGDDGDLRSQVAAMLEQDASGNSLLDRGLAHLAEKTLADPAPLIAKELGPYRIWRLLGEGGMGVVYLAERKDLASQVAIKVLRDAWISPARRERFASEQRTLAQLNHPSIARLYDAATIDDGTPYFVMEYVEGIPLTQYCRKHRCSTEARLHLLRSVCEAVQHAHANAVIHRDLKPSNILVKNDGTVRLLDFGIAKQLESLDLRVEQTITGLRLMTPAYASPEQVLGEGVGIGTDVYSLGVILYELLTGELPFDLSNLTPAEASTIIAEHEPARPSVAAKRARPSDPSASLPALSEQAWADLDVLCLTAMHKEPERRYRSVEALIRDIDHYLRGEPLEARPDTLGYRTTKFVRRNSRAVATAALLFVVIVGLIAFFTIRLARARDAARDEAARTQRIQQFMTNLFQGGDEAAGPSDSLRVLTIVDRGAQQARSLNRDPKVQADLYANLGGIYQKLGKLDQADSLLQSALDERKAIFGADSPEAAESLIAVGLLRSDQAHLEQAEQLIRQGLEIDKRRLPPDHPAMAKALLAFGKVLAQRGSYEPALQALNEAVRIESAPGVAPSDLAASLSELAAAQYSAGHYPASDSLYRRLLEMHRKLYGDRHPLLADDLGNLGAIQLDLGYYPESERFDRQALEITESYYGKDHPKTAANLMTLGRALEYQNKFDEAEHVLQQALAILEHVYGTVHPTVAETLNELGNVADMRENLDEAQAKFRQVLEIYRAVYGEHHYAVAIATSNLATVYMDKKDYPHAEQLFRNTVRLLTETLGSDNVNTGIAHIKLGRTLLREKRYQEAEVETRAGYENQIRQTSPNTSFLRAARKDLIADYEGMGQPEKAAKYRAELAQTSAAPAQKH
jgi:eukaryotic-like serine/threonine-protein kinase